TAADHAGHCRHEAQATALRGDMMLGCIADDFTGATDLGNSLVRGGLRAAQTIRVPSAPLATGLDAIVVALKTRTTEPAAAVKQSLEALEWLRKNGCDR